MSEPIIITVPMVAPSVNHYKEPIKIFNRRTGLMRTSFKVTDKAATFKELVAWEARRRTLVPADANKHAVSKLRYRLTAFVYLGAGERGDGDNFWKCIADALKDAGVIHSDAMVKEWFLFVGRDIEHPRTTVIAESIDCESGIACLLNAISEVFERRKG